MAKVNFLNEAVSFQEATFLNFVAMHIIKPENEDTLHRE